MAEHPELDEKMAAIIAPKMQSYEELVFNFVMMLLM